MTARKSIDDVAALVASAVALTEGRFLTMGRNLETAMGILARLVTTFGELQADLESEGLRSAVDDLSRVASQVQAIGDTHGRRKDVLARLTDLTDGIAGRVARMRQAVRSAAVLGVNAKIAAAGMGSAGAEFMEFSDEIVRSLKLAGGNLEDLDRELRGLGSQVRGASAGADEFERLQTGAGKSIPRRLTVGVQTIATRRSEAAASSSTIAAHSQQTHQQVGSAVMALQIGDSTRQRAEHMQHSLAILTDALAPQDRDDGEAGGDPLIAKVCRLVGAQLTDTAEEFSREAARLLTALDGLARDAHEIGRLGDVTFGAAAGRGSLLQELDGEIGQAKRLLDGFQGARSAADRLAATVADGAADLAAQIKTLRSLETDIRILALNTALKCGRVGDQGRSLDVIARELREFSAATEKEATVIAADLDRVVGVAGTLDDGTAGDIRSAATLMDTMTRAAAQLGACERGFTSALTILTRDGETIARLLDETASCISTCDEISDLLRQAAAALAGLHDGIDCEGSIDAGEQIFASIHGLYTMARERDVHARVTGSSPAGGSVGSAGRPAETPPAGEAGLDDILF